MMISWLLAENIISQSANRIRCGREERESDTNRVGGRVGDENAIDDCRSAPK
jgi:hypothetical protein